MGGDYFFFIVTIPQSQLANLSFGESHVQCFELKFSERKHLSASLNEQI
jgi:hypothetical protein